MGVMEKLLEGLGVNPQQVIAASEQIAAKLNAIEQGQIILNQNIVKAYQMLAETKELINELRQNARFLAPDHSEVPANSTTHLAIKNGEYHSDNTLDSGAGDGDRILNS